MDNLSLYLSIYKEVLKAFKVIQSHNVTHYDIKCDNILIDFKHEEENEEGNERNPKAYRSSKNERVSLGYERLN